MDTQNKPRSFWEKFYRPSSCPGSLVSFNPLKYFLYILSLIICYVAIRRISKRMNWSERQKTPDQHIQDITVMLIMATVSFTFGNYSNTFDQWTVFGMFLGTLVFTWISNMPGFTTSLMGVSDWGPQMWAVIMVSAMVIIIFMLYVLNNSYKCDTLFEVLAYLVIFIGWIVAMFVFKKNGEEVHIHHYQIAWALSFFTSFDSIISKTLAGIVLSIFVNGISVYGPDPSVVPPATL